MTSDDEQRPPSRRPRRPRQDASPPASQGPQRADQGDLWADTEDEAPSTAPPGPTHGDIDSFVSDLPPPEEEPPPARPYVSRPVAPPPLYEGYEEYDDYDAEYSMLRNPYVLAALAVAAAIILAVVVVIAFSNRGNDGFSGGAGTARTATPLPGELPGVQAKVIAIAAIREGPGLEYFELGLLRNGQEVSVVGRNEDSSWYQVIFAGSDLKGWVPHSALRLPDNSDSAIEVVVFTPIPKPSVEQPTATPLPVTPTEEALGAPDISVEILGNVCPTNGPLTIALRNVGDVPLNSREVVVTVSTPDLVLSEQTLSVTLGLGQIVPVSTGQAVQPPRTMVAVVFLNEPQDLDPSNNVVTCVVSEGGGGQSGTAVPPPLDETPTP